MITIRTIGRFWRLDVISFIKNDAAPEKIPAAYSGLITEIRDSYLQHLGDRVLGVYVRGSVPRGMAVEGVSDLDDFALLKRGSPEPNPSWRAGVAERLLECYPFLAGVGLKCLNLDELGDGERFSELGLLMVTQAVCLWGEDVIPALPRYKPGVLVANNDLCQIRADLELAVAQLGARQTRRLSLARS